MWRPPGTRRRAEQTLPFWTPSSLEHEHVPHPDLPRPGSTDAWNWVAVPNIRGPEGTNAVSVALNNNDILAYNGSSLITVGRYAPGRWHHIRTVIHVDAQRFDLIVDGVMILWRANLRSPLGGVSVVDFDADAANLGTTYINNLKSHHRLTAAGGTARGRCPPLRPVRAGLRIAVPAH